MGTSSVFYWLSVAIALYAGYLLGFCLYKVDGRGQYARKTDERIYVPRIVYPFAVAVSFVPILNLILGMLVIATGIIASIVVEEFYFKSWLLDTPKQKEKEKENP